MRCGDHDVRQQRELEAAADRKPVHRRDHRLVELPFEPHEAMRSKILAGVAGCHGLEIPASAEHALAGRGDDRAAQAGRVAEPSECGIEVAACLLVEGVRWRMVEGDLEHRAVLLDPDS